VAKKHFVRGTIKFPRRRYTVGLGKDILEAFGLTGNGHCDLWGCRGARITNFAPEVDIVKKLNWLLCVLMAVALTGSAVFAEQADPAGKKKKKPNRVRKQRPPRKRKAKGLRGEYAIMASELKLTDEQQKQLLEIVKARAEARKAKNAEAAELKKQYNEAKKAKDKAKANELRAKLKALRGDPKADRAKILAILTDEQKAQWSVFQLYRNVCRKFGRAKLTDDQKTAIRALCAKDASKLTGDRKADAAVMKSLAKRISADILTDEQREAMTKKRPPRRKKDKPAREKKPRKKKNADQ